MPVLSKSLAAWGSPKFSQALLQELRALKPGALPLHGEGGLIDFSEITISITSLGSDEQLLKVNVGVFFTETVGGGSCGFESEPQQKYCDVQIEINRETAEAVFVIV